MLDRNVAKFFSVLLLSFVSLAAVAQAPRPAALHAEAASSPAAPTQPSGDTDGALHITLGQSVYPLNGPYKFTIGDSPTDPLTHKPLWAEPTFDDSHWETVDLTPPAGSYDPIAGIPDYVPGWTAKGHPGYYGFAWYRIRVKVEGLNGGKLALAGSDNIDDGFQAFANGTLLGSFGDFSTARPTVYNTQPTLFPIPPSAQGTAADGTQVLAFRIWMQPATLQTTPDAGGFHTAPFLGHADLVAASYQVRWLELVRSTGAALVEIALFLLLAVLAFSLSIFDRSDKVYYWIAGVYTLSACNAGVEAISFLSQSISMTMFNLVTKITILPFTIAIWVMIWKVWFQLKRPVWLPKTICVLTLLYMVCQFLSQEVIFGLIPHPVAVKFHPLSLAVRFAFLALLVLIVILGIRQKGREGWVALPAVLMLGVARFQTELAVLHIRLDWFPFGVGVSLGAVSSLLLVLTLFILLLRRLFFSLRAQREQALDIQQAAEVQQVILPDSESTYPGLLIETEFRPAREVGGDFFQVIPHPTDGSTLIVAGDVTGKGLQAGMLVALLVGAIRSTAELNPDPLVILQALNRRLLGRRSAQATCLVLRIAADGNATLANAGHLPPYLDGRPLDMQGALPLGMIDGAEFSVMHFQLNLREKLVVISDGILEATDAEGQLFGFDRVADLLRHATVKALADAAQLFGQNDDISLVAVTRTV